MKQFLLSAIAGAAVFAMCGCATSVARTDEPKESGGLMPATNPLEDLDEARMEEAIRGLEFRDGLVFVSRARNDKRNGETLRAKADKSIEAENVWFHSVGYFRDALLADATNAKSYEGLARAFLMEGTASKALCALNSALKLQPNFSQARYELGLVKQMQGDYSGAVSEWKTLTWTDPGYGDAFARMAIASYYAQDFTSSRTFFAEAIKRRQNVPPQFRGLLEEADPRP